jgi:REP element-mobilizing transposase RayT
VLEIAAMPSTHLSLHFHVVFSTKNREPRVASEWRDRLHAFLGGVARTSDSVPEAIGGVADHVHMLLGLKATTRLSDVVRAIKAVSSKWVHDEIGDRAFKWQDGYGAFTVSPSQRDTVRSYISRQEEHHRKRSFQEEYLELLQRCGVDFDERYSLVNGNFPPPLRGLIVLVIAVRWLAPPANFRDPSGIGIKPIAARSEFDPRAAFGDLNRLCRSAAA